MNRYALSMSCLKCQSIHVIPDVRVIDRDRNMARDLTVAVEVVPENILFENRASSRSALRAQVCADCGFTELYAINPEKLWDAMLANQSSY